jgi:hypothetical protein
MNANDVITFLVIAAGTLAITAGGFAIAWVRTREQLFRRDHGAALSASGDEVRLDRIERAVESIAIEIERLGESDRFATQLLAQRAIGEDPKRAASGRVITPH